MFSMRKPKALAKSLFCTGGNLPGPCASVDPKPNLLKPLEVWMIGNPTLTQLQWGVMAI